MIVKAYLVQRRLKEDGYGIAVVVNIGKGVQYRLPDGKWVYVDKKFTVSEVLNSIREGSTLNDEDMVVDSAEDNVDEEGSTGTNEGFLGSIFVFGFALMRRGISYRSNTDVPTHILMQMGKGHNIENAVQTLGRATFIGRSLLKANGFTHVKALVSEEDFNMIQGYQRYVKVVDKRASLGENVFDAMSGSRKELPEDANYLQWTDRRTGMLAKSKPNSLDSFHNPRFADSGVQLSSQDKERIQWYANDKNQECYRTAKICRELWDKAAVQFHTDDIVEGYNDHYSHRDDVAAITKERVIKHMRAIKNDRLFKESPCLLDETTHRYEVKRFQLNRMHNFLLKIHLLRNERKRKRKSGDALSNTAKRMKVEEM